MMQPPPYPKPGAPVAPWAKSVTDFLRSLVPRQGAGTTLRHTSTGVSISIAPGDKLGGGGSGDLYRMPFDVYRVGSVLRVHPGLINNEAPETMQLGEDASAEDEDAAEGEDWEFEASAGFVFLKVKVTIPTGEVTLRELRKAATMPITPTPTATDTELTGYLQLAEVTGSGATLAVEQGYNGSRWVSLNFADVYCTSGGLEFLRALVWS